MLKSQWNPQYEKVVSAAQYAGVANALETGTNVIMDDTNLNPKTIPAIKKAVAHIKDLTIEIKYFKITRAEALRRDALRENPVGDKVIRGFFKKYITNKPGTETRFVVRQDSNLPHVVVVDIDGTVALREDRGYYQWHKVGQDNAWEPMCNLIRTLKSAGKTVIFLTGRNKEAHTETFNWLVKNNLEPDWLFTKPSTVQGPTKTWKKQVMEETIMPKFFVEMVFEDRPGEVKTFRDMGLLCLQVWADEGEIYG